VFASNCILNPANGSRPLWWSKGVARNFQWRGFWRGLEAESRFLSTSNPGVWGEVPSRRRQDDLGAKLTALGDFCNFLIKITQFYAYFGQKIYFKAITHQFKAFEKQSKRTK